MYTLLLLGVVSFLASLMLTPLIRSVFNRLGLVDHPDADRKHHKTAVPRAGGVAIIIAYISAFSILSLTGSISSSLVESALPWLVMFSPAALVVFATGLFDDVFGLKPWQKIAGEVLAASMVYFAGVQVDGFAGHVFAHWLSFPLTLGWLVLCCNAVNLIDGLDGLATGIGLFASATMLLSALLHDNLILALLTIPLVGCLAGFLRYNFNPATIFLGDSGSLLIGFLLGCYGVLWSQKSATILGMSAPLIALSIPLLDTTLSIGRRFLSGQPVFGGDRGHIHHRLLDRGFTPRRAALLLYAVCAISALFSLLMASRGLEGLIIPIFCCVAWIGINRLGYVEFDVAGRMLREGAFRKQVSGQISLYQYERLLRAATTREECWNVIQKACLEFGFEQVQLRYAGSSFGYSERARSACFEIRVPISAQDEILFARPFDGTAHATIVTDFINTVRRVLLEKSSAFRVTADSNAGQRPAPELSRAVGR